MMDAVVAAAMSDPTMNRRQAIVEAPAPVAQQVSFEHLGRELLSERRRGRVDQGSTTL